MNFATDSSALVDSAAPLRLHGILRQHTASGYADFGVIVRIESVALARDRERRRFWYIELPNAAKAKKGDDEPDAGSQLVYHLKAPVKANVAYTLRAIAAGKLSVVDPTPRAAQLLSDDQLAGTTPSRDLERRSRRNLSKWKDRRDKALGLIRPILEKLTMEQLFEGGMLATACRERARELGLRTPAKVIQAMHRFLAYGQNESAVLPRFDRQGRPGGRKFSSVPTGRPNRGGSPRFAMTELASEHCRNGWNKHKKRGVSARHAYLLTMEEHWVETKTYTSPTEAVVTLKPPHVRPTENQFLRHGPAGDPAASALRINLGEHHYQRQTRPLIGLHTDGIRAVGQRGVIDATPEDHRPVSAASPLLELPSTWRTLLKDEKSSYLFGVYRGFEHGGTLPALMCIHNAAADKVEFCAERNVTIAPGDWHSINFRTVAGDHGDLKSVLGIEALSTSQTTLEIVRSWAAELKSVETDHRSLHRTADHVAIGTTLGQRETRVDRHQAGPGPTFESQWPKVIRAILRFNNEVHVPDLRTVEMGMLVPTRKNIFEWYLANGYTASEPIDMSYIRARCLPTLNGRIKRDGIHVLDPRKTETFIPGLVYDGEWLNATPWKQRGAGVQPCTIHLDPSRIGKAYMASSQGLSRLKLKTHDPLRGTLALVDWLAICDEQNLKAFLAIERLDNVEATLYASAAEDNKADKKRYCEAVAAQATNGKTPRGNKIANRAVEQERLDLQRLGLPPTPAPLAPPSAATAYMANDSLAGELWTPMGFSDSDLALDDPIQVNESRK